MWARTLCPLSSSTRNCVLGSASVTVPSTSITSSLVKDLPFLLLRATKQPGPNGYFTMYTTYLLLLVPRKDPWPVLGNGNSMLEVGGQGTIGGVDGPSVPFREANIVIA